MKNQNQRTLDSFVAYCARNPDERFWQALTNWSGYPFVGWAESFDIKGFHDMWNDQGIVEVEGEM